MGEETNGEMAERIHGLMNVMNGCGDGDTGDGINDDDDDADDYYEMDDASNGNEDANEHDHATKDHDGKTYKMSCWRKCR